MSTRSFSVESPVTNLAVTTTDGAVTRIRFGKKARRPAETRFERQVAQQLSEYLAGRRDEFTFPTEPEGTDFDRSVWDQLARIPYGETRTYGQVARAIGKPKAARAVGTANGRNPIPIVVPCHRVVAGGGKLGGFGGGLSLKRKLLQLEAAKSPVVR